MRVAVYQSQPSQTDLQAPNIKIDSTISTSATLSASATLAEATSSDPLTNDPEGQGVTYVNMANGWTMAILGWLIWAFIAGLNVYLIVQLGLGNG